MSIRAIYDRMKGLYQEVGDSGFEIKSTLKYENAVEAVAVVTEDTNAAHRSFLAVDATGGDVVITLPPASDGRLLTVKKIDDSGFSVTLQPSDGAGIDSGSTAIITAQWTSLTIQAAGGEWYIR